MSQAFNFKIKVDAKRYMSRMNPRYATAQKWLDNEVLKDSGPYVPFRHGHLFRSGIAATRIGSGEIEYNAPYARRLYYGIRMHFSRDKHPQASAQWFEKAKAVNKRKWMERVKKILGGVRTSG